MDKRHAETIERENGNNIWNSFHSNLESSGRKEESIWKEIIKLEAAQLSNIHQSYIQHPTWYIIPTQKHSHKVHLILLRSQQDTTRSNKLPFHTPTLSPPSQVILQNPHLFWDLQALHCLRIAIGALLHSAGLFFYSFFLFQ